VTERVLKPRRIIDADKTYNALIGLKMAEWREGFARMEIEIQEHHMNRQGIVHGGILATMIDSAAGYAGAFSTELPFGLPRATLSMSVNYIESAAEGRLICTGRRTGGGKRTFTATAEVHDDKGALLATGQTVYRLLNFG